MSLSCRFERSLMSREEYEAVLPTHHPAIYEVADEDLQAARKRLRDLQDRERTLYRQLRRTLRGKAAERGGSFPGTVERPGRRKQVFAAAVKRINSELQRRREIEARATHVEAARKALALRRAQNFAGNPFIGETAADGMQPLPNTRRRTRVPGQKIGSVSQQGKAAQARRDAR